MGRKNTFSDFLLVLSWDWFFSQYICLKSINSRWFTDNNILRSVLNVWNNNNSWPSSYIVAKCDQWTMFNNGKWVWRWEVNDSNSASWPCTWFWNVVQLTRKLTIARTCLQIILSSKTYGPKTNGNHPPPSVRNIMSSEIQISLNIKSTFCS